MSNTSRRGFASMDTERQRQIASKGGKAAHQRGTAHEFTTEEARLAGRKGGERRSQNAQRVQPSVLNTHGNGGSASILGMNANAVTAGLGTNSTNLAGNVSGGLAGLRKTSLDDGSVLRTGGSNTEKIIESVSYATNSQTGTL